VGGRQNPPTALNVAASLAGAERRVLAVDIDPQGNLSSGLGFPKAVVQRHVYHVLSGEASCDDILLASELEFLKVLPAHPDLAGAEIELVSLESRHLLLSQALQPLKRRFDFVLIDCPPSLGLLTLNALCAADSVLVPLQCEYYALEGLSHLLSTVERVRGAFNPRLELEGILLCMYDKRINLSRQVAEEVRQHFDGQVFETVIPRNVRLGESPSFGKPVLLYDIDSAGSRGYLQLAQELLHRRGDGRKQRRP
jgi:chromosome partitioning protein